MTILRNAEDFEWHKKALDANAKYQHRHNGGTPTCYPCIVESDYWDDPNGPYTFTHSFVYQVTVTCPNCGHKEIKWPHEIMEA